MARKLNGIELTRYDDLFKTDAEREADQQERVQIVPAEQVFPYARQPYVIGEIINADYKITARVCVGNAEFALGEHPKAPAPFVTWQRNCKNDEDGPPNFFWGHYGADRAAMIEDFCERAGSEYQEQKEYRQNKEHETKQRLSKGKER